MLRKLIGNEVARARHERSLFGPYLDSYLAAQAERGFAASTLCNKLRGVTHFGEYLAERNIESASEITEQLAEGFFVSEEDRVSRRSFMRTSAHKAVNDMLDHLQEHGVITWRDPLLALKQGPVEEFCCSLRDEYGLAERSIERRRHDVDQFLRFLRCDGSVDSLAGLTQVDLDAFLVHAGKRHARTGMPTICSSLRQFLRYLFRLEILSTDLSETVLKPRTYALERLPCALPWETVKHVLEVQDPGTPTGLRNLAVLWLLVTYGLRPGEVSKLRLGDIDWRRDTIVFRRSKIGRPLHRPLLREAGDAILNYLRRGRPVTALREVFITVRAPLAPMKSDAVTYMVEQSLDKAGIESKLRGAYLIRHSFAMHLLRQGEPLKTISDMLGHRDPNVVFQYTKLATDDLRNVALPMSRVMPGASYGSNPSATFSAAKFATEDLQVVVGSAAEVLPS